MCVGVLLAPCVKVVLAAIINHTSYYISERCYARDSLLAGEVRAAAGLLGALEAAAAVGSCCGWPA